MSLDETVGQRLRRLRVAAGLTQRELGEAGVTFAYISRIETDQRAPSVKALIKIASKLDVAPLELMVGDPHADCPMCHRSARDG